MILPPFCLYRSISAASSLLVMSEFLTGLRNTWLNIFLFILLVCILVKIWLHSFVQNECLWDFGVNKEPQCLQMTSTFFPFLSLINFLFRSNEYLLVYKDLQALEHLLTLPRFGLNNLPHSVHSTSWKDAERTLRLRIYQAR